jgi:hypothetical protein
MLTGIYPNLSLGTRVDIKETTENRIQEFIIKL